MLDPETTGHKDLRGGTSPWRRGPAIHRTPLAGSLRCEVLVVGAGITGSILADHLTRLGHDVCIVDRERSGYGSTAASTSMLMWEIDTSLSELSALYGFERAAAIYRRSFATVADLGAHMSAHRVSLRPRASLYLAADDTPPRELFEECDLRRRAGLPSEFLDRDGLRHAFSIDRPAALISEGSADADPLTLSHVLMQRAVARGARLIDAEAVAYHPGGASAGVELAEGFAVEARQVVLATGYVMPDIVKSNLHRVISTFALATPAQPPGTLWRDGALIWEATRSYFYARTTEDGRIVIGGEDEPDIVDQADRDRLMPEKMHRLAEKLRALWPRAQAIPQYAWSGAFGTTTDGLPLIGPVPGAKRIFAAYGYGGNGITFSFLASRMIGELIAGRRRGWFDDFALDRDGP